MVFCVCERKSEKNVPAEKIECNRWWQAAYDYMETNPNNNTKLFPEFSLTWMLCQHFPLTFPGFA